MKEIWKDVLGYEGVYMISNTGLIKSSERVWVCNNSFIVKPEKILRGYIDHYGYRTLLISKGNIQKRVKVHRLVAAAFIENPENKPNVNHINGVKDDNRVENLEWCTDKENMAHARRTGLVNDYGENSGKAKLKNEEVIEIIRLYKTGQYSQKQLSKMFNAHVMTISCILLGKSWKCITNGEEIDVPSRRKRQIVLNTQNGVFYDNIREAARTMNYNYSNLVAALSGVIKNKTPFIRA